MSQEALDTLRKLPLFARLTDESLNAVAERAVFRNVTRDTVLFRCGEPCRGLYIVVSGRVRVYRSNPDGREQVLHTQETGQPLAEVPLFDGGPYPASARAMEDSRLLFLGSDSFAWLYRTHPEIAEATIRELGRRLRRMVQLVEKISLRDVHARVAITLLEYGRAEGELPVGGTFQLPRTQEQLAAELGTTRESVSRAFARLKKEGLIAQRGTRIQILDARELELVATAG
jgi:CRP/FNR family transcriptional regulator, cyclic AMP receptor protein